jgi:hypothetical protein
MYPLQRIFGLKSIILKHEEFQFKYVEDFQKKCHKRNLETKVFLGGKHGEYTATVREDKRGVREWLICCYMHCMSE